MRPVDVRRRVGRNVRCVGTRCGVQSATCAACALDATSPQQVHAHAPLLARAGVPLQLSSRTPCPPIEPYRPAHAPEPLVRTNAPMYQCTDARIHEYTNAQCAIQLRLAEEREQGLRVALMRAEQEREQAVAERDAAPDSAKLRRRRGSSGRPSPRPKETPLLSPAPASQSRRASGGCPGIGGGGGGAGGGDGVEVDPNRASSNSTSPSGSSRSQSEVGPPSSPRASESAEATIARLRRENAELQRRCEQAETYATRCTRLLAAHEERCKLLTSMNVKLEQIVREGKTAAAAATAAAVGGAPPPASQQLATSPPSAATSPPPTFATPAASSQRAAHSAPPPSPLQPQPQAPPPARRAS